MYQGGGLVFLHNPISNRAKQTRGKTDNRLQQSEKANVCCRGKFLLEKANSISLTERKSSGKTDSKFDRHTTLLTKKYGP
jgi:hypothetical protein